MWKNSTKIIRVSKLKIFFLYVVKVPNCISHLSYNIINIIDVCYKKITEQFVLADLKVTIKNNEKHIKVSYRK